MQNDLFNIEELDAIINAKKKEKHQVQMDAGQNWQNGLMKPTGSP